MTYITINQPKSIIQVMKALCTLFFLGCFSFYLHAQASDFTYTDLNGDTHSLYADYLDQGIPVVLTISATWAGPDFEFWHSTGYLENFYQNYGTGSNPDVMVLHIEADPTTTDDDLYGTGPSTVGDWVTGISYPIINVPDNSFIDNYEVLYFPSIVMICPDGTAYCDYSQTANLNQDESLFYGELLGDPNALQIRFFENCGVSFDRSRLDGLVYHDENEDCSADPGESGLPQFMAHITGPGTDIYRMTDVDGLFRNLLDSGTYEVQVAAPNSYWSLCNNNETIEVSNNIDSFELHFGAQAVWDCPSGEIDITAPILIRCFENELFVDYCNTGTIPAEDASIEVTLDSFFNFVGSVPAPSSQNGNVLTFDLGTVGVGECGELLIIVEVSCDADISQIHCYSAQFYPDTVCIPSFVASTAYAEECQPNVGGYDPNDKRGFPEGVGATNDILPNQEMKYQIRFQNEGTWTAFNVVVEDELPEQLDISTFRPGASSHPYQLEIEGRTLRFIFENINLPHADADEPGSHGFVNFFISQNPDLPHGTQILNSAAIYFDFNEPVITNEHLYTINTGVVNINEVENLDFSVQPNPATDEVRIVCSREIKQGTIVQVFHANGQLILEQQISGTVSTLSLNDWSNGVYYVQLVDETTGLRNMRKLVVAK